ncbi:hypothetical protein BFJ69_g7146 [Fusarium oxysporum]|uniref:Uncharacterized protein n=1 Tax=Fusarium oxysporum TaxID=5507 RepID=A0A420N7I8_FUSOX|nr:hypothetical protein BFJ69_g7146 [Fusarium oxysporum]
MLPTPLQGTYQQDKADTDSVAGSEHGSLQRQKCAVTQLIYSLPLPSNHLNLEEEAI